MWRCRHPKDFFFFFLTAHHPSHLGCYARLMTFSDMHCSPEPIQTSPRGALYEYADVRMSWSGHFKELHLASSRAKGLPDVWSRLGVNRAGHWTDNSQRAGGQWRWWKKPPCIRVIVLSAFHSSQKSGFAFDKNRCKLTSTGSKPVFQMLCPFPFGALTLLGEFYLSRKLSVFRCCHLCERTTERKIRGAEWISFNLLIKHLSVGKLS